MSLNLNEVEQSRTVVVYANISNAGVQQYPWVQDLSNLGFQPDFAVIRSISANMPTANQTDSVYAVWSDLNNDYIATFPGKVSTSAVQTVIPIKKPIGQVSFNLYEVQTVASPNPNSLGAVTALGGTWKLTLTLEFVKLANYKWLHKVQSR